MKRCSGLIILLCLTIPAVACLAVSAGRLAHDYQSGALILESCIRRAAACASEAIKSDDLQTRYGYAAGMSGALRPASGLVGVLTYYDRTDSELAESVDRIVDLFLRWFDEPTEEELHEMLDKLQVLLGLIETAKADGRINRKELTRSLRRFGS